MKQETVCAIAAELFFVNDSGVSSSKGACVCAIVALPSRPPKYSLVCYNAQQVTFCVARMSWVDGQNTSLRLIVAPSGHVSFNDSTDQRWTIFFAEAAQLARFLACVGVAFYSLYGAPVTSVFSQDLSLPSSSLPLEAADRATVSFTGFQLCEKDGVFNVDKITQQRGTREGDDDSPDAAYVFQPKPSAVQLSHSCFGFEGSVLGMREGDRRVFVVPAGYTTSVSVSLTNVAAEGAVYVVQLQRVEHTRDDDDTDEAKDGRTFVNATAGSNVAATPPTVYAAMADADHARSEAHELTLVDPSLSPTEAATAAAAAVVAVAQPSTSAVPAFLSPSGIPPEHMSVLRKVELGVNAAVTSARDVRDVAAIFSQEWHQHVERPKPSLLSNKALVEQVQRVVTEEETAQAQLDECDRFLHVLEARNKELQQRIDQATVESQKLLEKKKSASTKAMDARLERDRQLVRLKDALLLKRQEREDLQRHIAALQRAVDVTNEELRQVQGKRDVHQVEVRSMAERLAAVQETLSEERHRNAALTAKTAATEECLKKAQTQQRIAEGQLTTARGVAEKARLRYMQIMEEERHHRTQDAELLRQDILDELDARERQYQVNRRRIAEEEFSRGLRDGKVNGRQAAETDLLGHQNELQLNLQRAKTEVETTKEAVRHSIESAMSLRRTLGGKVSELEEQLTQATRRQTQLQFEVAQWQTRCRTVRDTVGEHWRTLVSYATHPCTRQELLAMMKAVRCAEEKSYAEDADGDEALVRVDLQFQLELWQQSRRQSVEQRLRWIVADMLDIYVKGADYHFEHEWAQPVAEAHAATLEAVAQLYADAHGSRVLFDLCVQEAQERYAQQLEWWRAIKRIENWLAAQREAQDAVRAEETKARQLLWKAYMDGGDAVVQLCAEQLRAQVLLLQEEIKDRDGIMAEESILRDRLPVDAQQLWASDCAAALHLLEESEEAVRAGLEAEAYTAISGIKFQFAYAQRGVEEAVQQRVQQEELCGAEFDARQVVEREAGIEMDGISKEAAAAFASPPLPLTAYEEAPPAAPPLVKVEAPSSPSSPPPASPLTSLTAPVAVIPSNDSNMKPPHTGASLPPPPHRFSAAAFNLADSPCVSSDAIAHPNPNKEDNRPTTINEDTDDVRNNLVTADEPPPLLPSDADEEGEVENEAVGGNEKRTTKHDAQRPAASPLLPPQPTQRPHASSAHKYHSAATTATSYADCDTPPPLPTEGDGDAAALRRYTSSSSSDKSSFPSTFTAFHLTVVAASANSAMDTSRARAASSPPPQTAIAKIVFDDEARAVAEEVSSRPVSGEAERLKHVFGGSSSENDSDSNEFKMGQVSASLGAPSKSGPPPSSASALAKPKLFDSSDND